jgi:hypothetical protein
MKAIQIIILIVFVIFLFSTGVFYYKYPHLWKPVNSAKITYNDQEYEGSEVYRSSNGEILLNVKGVSYIYFPNSQRLGIPSSNLFCTLGPFIFSKELPPSVVWADDDIKVTTKPNLIITENGIEFTNHEGKRIRIVFSS